ncbi:uncharacterized protein LOC108051760 [Drosophila rhopaloa]|uniref:Uncharacterized protein LOC108051760 n=1 Tax=Drosophila rhopaloa TaxID=1041015 RepID=A0A6P4FPS7_DRORH|nr:uncharacterized protein LOC108051760 [Drosophila rhopaloa]
MKSFGNLTCGLLILTACIFAGVEARRLALRPLSEKELRKALRESGIGEDSAAGKSVASALSGISGFALGITKGIGGSILFDVVTSNVTIDYLTSLLSSTASSTTSSSSGTAQEVCFNSRSADGEIINGRSNADIEESADPSGQWRQDGSGTYSDLVSSPSGTSSTGSSSGSSGTTCIVLSKGSRRRRQLRIRPGKLRSTNAKRRTSHGQVLKKYRRHRL